jgi:predicted GIY-YIG superfamily endonuclease
MKQCKKCSELKPLGDFNKDRSEFDGLNIYCRLCISIKSKIYRDKYTEKTLLRNRDSYKKFMEREKIHNVYLLPNENYIGTTCDLSHRLSYHRRVYGRDTNGYRILYSTTDRSEALEFERLLHDIGYEGRHKRNSYQ